MGYRGNMTSTEIYEEFDKLCIKHSALISKLECTLKSSGGPNVDEIEKSIYYYKVGNESDSSDAPKILINAGIHAREWAPPDAVLSFFGTLLEAYDRPDGPIPFSTPGFDMDAKIDWEFDMFHFGSVKFNSWGFSKDEVIRFVEKLEIYILPVSNPDGRDFSFPTEGDSSTKWERLWRKNRRPLEVDPCINGPAIGVDLNRNFDIAFKMDEYYSISGEPFAREATVPYNQPCGRDAFQVYQGPSENSENETKNLTELIDTLGITYYLDIHSHDRSFLIPWGMNSTQNYTKIDNSETFLNSNLDRSVSGGRNFNEDNLDTDYREYFPDYEGFDLLAKHRFLSELMSDTIYKAADCDIHAGRRSNYQVLPSAGLYPTVGGSSDYALSTCMQSDISGHAEVIPSKFPIFSLTMEAGHDSDGEFWPSRKRKQYNKVEREIHCALRGLFAYATNIERYRVSKTEK